MFYQFLARVEVHPKGIAVCFTVNPLNRRNRWLSRWYPLCHSQSTLWRWKWFIVYRCKGQDKKKKFRYLEEEGERVVDYSDFLFLCAICLMIMFSSGNCLVLNGRLLIFWTLKKKNCDHRWENWTSLLVRWQTLLDRKESW